MTIRLSHTTRTIMAGALGGLLALAPVTLSGGAQEPETPDVFPAGPGRDETFYVCTACHGSAIVRQQGMSRERWNDTIDYMIERHKLAPLDDALRAAIVWYLTATFPPRRRGFENPFLNP